MNRFGRDGGGETEGLVRGKETKGKSQRERYRGKETEGKRQRGRDRGEETEGKRQRGRGRRDRCKRNGKKETEWNS